MTMKNKFIIYLITILVLILPLALSSCSKPEQQEPPTVSAQKLHTPENLKAERKVVTWDAVENASEYIVNFENTEYRTSECRFELDFYDIPGTYNIEVKAVDTKNVYEASEWAQTSAVIYETVAHGYDDFGFEYTLLEDGTGYEMSQGHANLKGDIVIPDYFRDLPVKRIKDYAFFPDKKAVQDWWGNVVNGNTITTGIKLPIHLESIGTKAFAHVQKIKEINIPDTVTTIKMNAFQGCISLTKVKLPQNLTEIPPYCFQHTALEEINFPSTLERIGNDAFSTPIKREVYYPTGEVIINKIYSNLTSIVIPESVTYIGDRAFDSREKLLRIKISIPDKLEYFGEDVFKDTLWYEAQPDGPLYVENKILYGYKGAMPEGFVLEIPEGVCCIATHSMKKQANLKKVIIPGSVKIIESYAFIGCSSLSEVIFLGDGLENIGEGAFNTTTSLKSIDLPETIVFINADAFFNSGLENIRIPGGVATITIALFSSCTNLTYVILPNSIEHIKLRSFDACTSLKYVFFEGSGSDFEKIKNEADLLDATVYFYSETAPTAEGNFWHYVDGEPTPWN